MTLQIDNPDKIGIGTWDFDSGGTALTHVEDMQFSWYYNWRGDALWDASTSADTLTSEFVPTIWGRDEVDPDLLDRIANSSAETLLGFNEPDNKTQANMSVEEALSLWPDLMATGLRLGSPAPTTEQAVGENTWLGRFMKGAEEKGYRVDFIATHYYSDDMDVNAFKAHLEAVYEAYGRPVWVTEWALVDWDNPDRFTQEEIAAFALEAIQMMDDLPFVERHAWFGAYAGGDGWHINTELFDSDGQLTAVGDAFASAIGGVDDLQIAGTGGDDTLYGDGGDDELSGDSGDDVLHGRSGNDTIYGQGGNDTLYGGAGNDIIGGGWGRDTLLGGDDNDALYGGVGADKVYGEAGDDFLVGGPGTDLLAGGDGNDALLGGSENDLLYGGNGNDRMYGQEGNDKLHGCAGNDVMGGGDGHDTLLGGSGHDQLFGGAGNDVLVGGEGNDWLMGNAGTDRFVFRPGGGEDTVLDFDDGVDLLSFTPFGFADKTDVLNSAYQDGSNVVIDLPEGEVVNLNSFNLALLDAGDIVI